MLHLSLYSVHLHAQNDERARHARGIGVGPVPDNEGRDQTESQHIRCMALVVPARVPRDDLAALLKIRPAQAEIIAREAM